MALLFEELDRAYEGLALEEIVDVNRFVRFISTANVEQTDEFWRDELAGAVQTTFPSLPSPGYRPLPNSSFSCNFRLSRKTDSPITTPTVIRAAWATLINHYSNTSGDVLFGSTVHGRNAPVPGIEKMLGPTITTIPVRVRFPAKQKVVEFLHSIQSQAATMMPHEHYGLQNIMRLSLETRAACAFENLLIIHPGEEKEPRRSVLGLQTASSETENLYSYALTSELELGADSLQLKIVYDNQILHQQQVKRFSRLFRHIMEQLCLEEDQELRDLDFLNLEDLTEIRGWNSALPKTEEALVHELILRQVKQHPDHLALWASDGRMNYQQIFGLSMTLSRHLRNLKVGPEVLVPIMFEKSKFAIIAMFSILLAGGACVPLNPDHPIARNEVIIRDAGAAMLLVSSKYAASIQGRVGFVVEVSESYFSRSATYMDNVLDDEWECCDSVCPNNTAFVMYSSGSRGVPKGICIEHAAFCSSAKAHGDAFRIAANTRALQFSSFTFDLSLFEIFTTLTRGGVVCMPSDEDRVDNVGSFIRHTGANWAYLTPSFVRGALKPSDVPSLQSLTLGGEAVAQDNIDEWASSTVLTNGYGPTEASVCVVENIVSGSRSGTIGRGIGCRTWIVDPDEHHKLVAIGAIGELMIEGPLLARGYLNDPEKTNAAFIEQTAFLSTNTTCRMHKTGDLARYNHDGSIQYLGRKDCQVKLRGQRIELLEVEYHLRHCLSSQLDLAVEMTSAEEGSAVLAAFFVLPYDSALEKLGTLEGSSQQRLRETLNGVESRLRGMVPA